MTNQSKIEMVYSSQCQNISEVRRIMRKALLVNGFAVFWKEWISEDKALPKRLKSEAQLSIFMDEKLILASESNIPTEQELSKLIEATTSNSSYKSKLKRKLPKINMTLFSAIGVLIIPKCPLCWAAYMSIFSALGVSTIEYQAWLLPSMLILLALSVSLALYQAFKRKRYNYIRIIVVGVLLVLLGKFVINSSPTMYFGIAVLFGAYIRHQLLLRNFKFQFKSNRKILSNLLQKK